VNGTDSWKFALPDTTDSEKKLSFLNLINIQINLINIQFSLIKLLDHRSTGSKQDQLQFRLI